eukprot:gene13491-biopygen3518
MEETVSPALQQGETPDADRTLSGRGPHDRIQRNGRAPEAGRTRAWPFLPYQRAERQRTRAGMRAPWLPGARGRAHARSACRARVRRVCLQGAWNVHL